MATNFNRGDISVHVASTIEDLIACQRIRSACFMSGAEPEPYMEQFDGNDFSSATHLVASRKGAPVGSMRIRILNCGAAAEATWEKLSVLPGERGSLAVLNALAWGAVQYSALKGVTTVWGLARDPRVMKFWKRTLNGVVTDDPPIRYEDREYVHIRVDLRPYAEAGPPVRLEEIEPDLFTRRMRAIAAQTEHRAVA